MCSWNEPAAQFLARKGSTLTAANSLFHTVRSLPVVALLAMGTMAPATVLCENAFPSCPHTHGVYYFNHGSWDLLHQASIAGARATGRQHAMFTYSSQGMAVYQGAKAPVTLSREPAFCISGHELTPKKLTLVRMVQRGDHRELQFVQKHMFRGPKVAFRPENVRALQISEESSNTAFIKPTTPLRPGQYVLIRPLQDESLTTQDGYDFGVQ